MNVHSSGVCTMSEKRAGSLQLLDIDPENLVDEIKISGDGPGWLYELARFLKITWLRLQGRAQQLAEGQSGEGEARGCPHGRERGSRREGARREGRQAPRRNHRCEASPEGDRHQGHQVRDQQPVPQQLAAERRGLPRYPRQVRGW